MEAKIRHLEMIRGAINSASDNSLRIKGFAMLLLAGAMALALRDGAGMSMIPLYFAVMLILLIIFLFIMDFYFIRQADLYRMLYNEVRVLSENDVDFSMEVGRFSPNLNQQYNRGIPIIVFATAGFHAAIATTLILGTLPPI